MVFDQRLAKETGGETASDGGRWCTCKGEKKYFLLYHPYFFESYFKFLDEFLFAFNFSL
jgi:hypothetical protein